MRRVPPTEGKTMSEAELELIVVEWFDDAEGDE